MLITNSEYLRPELMDIIRAFDCEDEEITHYFSFSEGKYFNSIEYEGEFYDFEDKEEVEDELVFKRLAKRYAKLALYKNSCKTPRLAYLRRAYGYKTDKLAYAEKNAGRNFSDLFGKWTSATGKFLLLTEF